MKRNSLLLLINIFLISFFLKLGTAEAIVAQAEAPPKIVLFLIDNVSWQEIKETKDAFFQQLIKKSSIGLLNNRTAGRLTRTTEYVTISAGARARGKRDSLAGLSIFEPFEDATARQVYERRYGLRAPLVGVVELGVDKLISDNEKNEYEIVPGLLGKSIASAGYQTAIIGNADVSTTYKHDLLHREAVVLAIDARSRLSLGDVSKRILRIDPQAPFGIRTNPDTLERLFKYFFSKVQFLVVDFGDTVRADLYSKYVSPTRAKELKEQAIRRASAFLKRIWPDINRSRATLIVASLVPPGSDEKPLKSEEEQLTPILFYGEDWSQGYLTSKTTKREGLVTNIDLGPTILAKLGVKIPYQMLGSQILVTPQKTDLDRLINLNFRAVKTKLTRPVTIISFIYFQVVLIILATLFLILAEKKDKRRAFFFEILILSILFYPLSSFVISIWPIFLFSSAVFTLLCFLTAIAAAAIVKTFSSDIYFPVLLVSLLTMAIWIGDLFLGSNIQSLSIFGFDLIRGSRFYGIGNEVMAILTATPLLATGILVQKIPQYKSWLLLGILLPIVLIIGLPVLGANTGGIITTVAAFLIFSFRIFKVKVHFFAIVAFLVILILVTFVGVDIITGTASHMGRSVKLIESGGFQQALLIMHRKVSMNLKILRYSSWSYFVLLMLGLIIYLGFKPQSLLHNFLSENEGFSAAITGAIVAGVIGFLSNDSGILIPSIILSYFLPAILYFLICRKVYSKREGLADKLS